METVKEIQGKRMSVLLLAAVLLLAPPTTAWRRRVEDFDEVMTTLEEEAEEKGDRFLLKNSKQVVKSEGGEVRVMRGYYEKATSQAAGPMHIGFVTMEPDTLFIPQYTDASLIVFVRRGEMKLGWIYKDDMVEKTLKIGDIYRIPAGSAFYIVNIGEGQRLQLICSIDTSESLRTDTFQSFYIGGGSYPTSVLAGFDPKTLSTAFNVSINELRPMMERQVKGPIISMNGSKQEMGREVFMQLNQQSRRGHKYWPEDEETEREDIRTWSWRKLLDFVLGKENKKGGSVGAPDSYNLYKKRPDFKNDYGWSLAVDYNDYAPLKHSGIGVYLVNLTAGSMMAPHVNPTATEYGIVLSGVGSVQVVYPNGTSAMNAEVREGDVFWVPRYFPFCQIASRSGRLEFFGFTTSARKNRPQFLAGASSVLRSMSGPEMAAAFDLSEDTYRRLTGKQDQSIILSSRSHPEHPPRQALSAGKWAAA